MLSKLDKKEKLGLYENREQLLIWKSPIKEHRKVPFKRVSLGFRFFPAKASNFGQFTANGSHLSVILITVNWNFFTVTFFLLLIGYIYFHLKSFLLKTMNNSFQMLLSQHLRHSTLYAVGHYHGKHPLL